MPHVKTNRDFAIGLARAGAGAIIFALPMFMTMELWYIGLYLESERILMLVLINAPLLVGLAHFSGFEETTGWIEDAIDAFVAYGVGIVTAFPIMALIGAVRWHASGENVVGQVAIEAIPASIGATLARSLLGEHPQEDDGKDGTQSPREISFSGDLFIMVAGALYLALNVAPTTETLAVSFQTSAWQVWTLAFASLVVLYAFSYALRFRGQKTLPEWVSRRQAFLTHVLGGYAAVWGTCALLLWGLGSLDGLGVAQAVAAVTILAFPASIGAASARLVL